MRAWSWLWLALVGCGGEAVSGQPALTAQGSESGDGSTSAEGTSGATKADTTDVDETGTDSAEATSSTGSDPSSESSEGSDETGEGPPQSCAVVSVEGMCGPVADCGPGSNAFGGASCDGPPSEQCCVPAEDACSVDGAPGVCMDVADCEAPFVSTAGLCPGLSNIQCCTDPSTACDPEAMPTPNEGLEEESWDAACPLGMIAVADFCVDRFEASLVELDGSGTVVGSWSPFHNPGTRRVRAMSIAGSIPQGYISGDQAADACAEAGKRLCDDAEWLRACQGSSGTTYPYGSSLQAGVCNDARSHPAVEYFGTSADWIWSELGNACISQIPNSVDTTGEHEGCVSEDGAFDMMGNLHEWTSAAAGTFRGGFYADTVINGPGCLYATTAHDTSHWDYSTGFRCCSG